ncbi:nucleotidyltransferase substrate binding protein [Avibacterium avium]|uniref:nucleotidyltransferase substrate binding protein n=1 Tax=Avibacterium avium TaxID=751 RepID=UPI003BF83CCD
MKQEIRWQQRLQNYQRAFTQLTEFVQQPKLNKFEQQGLVQCFEYNYELAWRVMKDYLNYQGISDIQGSRDAIRKAFNIGLIDDGQAWLDMVDDRILSVHSYNESTVNQIIEKIYRTYYPLFGQFEGKMVALCQENLA